MHQLDNAENICAVQLYNIILWIKALEDKPKDKASYMDEKYKDAVNMKQTMKMTNAFRKIIFLCFKCECLLLGKNATKFTKIVTWLVFP